MRVLFGLWDGVFVVIDIPFEQMNLSASGEFRGSRARLLCTTDLRREKVQINSMMKHSVNEPHDATCGPDEHERRSARRRPVSDDAFERAASLFRTAADVSRLKLLERLADGEWCVTELAEAAGSALSTVSQQLRMLRAERIVTRRRAGKHVFYSLADRHVIDMVHNALEHASERSHANGAVEDNIGHEEP